MSTKLAIQNDYTPIVVPVNLTNNIYALGIGFDPITGAVSSQQLDVPSLAEPPSGTANHYGPTLLSIANQSSLRTVFNAEASFAGSAAGGAAEGTATASYSETLSMSASSIALISTYTLITGSYAMNTNSEPPPNTWAPSTQAVDELIQAINKAGGYDEFVALNGSNFVGGYIYGVTFFGSYVAQFATFEDAINANAKLSGSYSGGSSGEINASLGTEMTAQTGYQSFQANSGGVYTPNPPVSSIATLNDAVTAVVSASVTPVPLYAITYDWRAIPAVGDAFPNGFNAGAFQQNLSALQPIIVQADYAGDTANVLANLVSGGSLYPVGPTSQTNAQSLAGTVQGLQAQINATTYETLAVPSSPIPSFITQLKTEVAAANTQALNIATGQANFNIGVGIQGDDRWCPESDLTYSPGVQPNGTLGGANFCCNLIQPAGGTPPAEVPPPDYYVIAKRTPQGPWNSSAGNNQTWYFGFSYYSADQSQQNPQPTLVASVGLVQNGEFVTAWLATDSEASSTTIVENGATYTTWMWKAQNPQSWPTTVPCSVTVTLL